MKTTEWNLHLCNVNGQPALTWAECSQHSSAPNPQLPVMGAVFVPMKSPRADGLPSADETKVLQEIEEKLAREIELGGGVHVGVISTQGRREFYYYLPTPEGFAAMTASAMTNFLNYAFEVKTVSEPNWSTYFDVLYPTRAERQSYKNNQVLQQLLAEGDNLTLSRLVEHYAYFPTKKSQAAFAERCRGEKFKVSLDSVDPNISARNFCVLLNRVDLIDLANINAVTIQLDKWAEELDGEYDGWQSPIVKPPTRSRSFFDKLLSR